jgi:hypothetical protein
MPTARGGAAALLAGAAAILVAASLFFGGGDRSGPLFWIGAGALLAVPLAVWQGGRATRAGAVCLLLLTAFVAWSGLSVAWSIESDRSWDYFNRGLVYLSFALLGVGLGSALRNAVRRTAIGLAVLLALVAFWALLEKVVPGLYPDYGRVARLRSPVGYYNALALALDFLLPLALWVAACRDRPHGVSATATVVAFAALVALLLLALYSVTR